MNKAVFIAWRGGGEDRGHWSPVARLEHLDGEYRFVYTRGARMLPGFRPFPGMPDLEEVYCSETLFPLLANRLLARSRPEYQAWLRWSDFDPSNTPDPLAILGVTEGIRQTDALEVFPRPVPDARGHYRSRFFLHGLRHASEEARERIVEMRPNDRLEIEVEDDNSYDPRAVAVLTNGQERLKLGYVPRYLARDVRGVISAHGFGAIDVRVVRVNTGAPLQMRLLCSLTTPWPADFEPCAGEEFVPLADEQVLEMAASGA